MQQFLDYFGNQPSAASARGELISRLKEAGRLLDAELAIWDGVPSAEAADRAAAAVRVAELLGQAGRGDAAALCYAWLGRQFAEVACGDGKTGKQLFEAHAQDEAVAKLLSRREPVWPVGNVEVVSRPAKNPRNDGFVQSGTELRGDFGPFFADVQLSVDASGRALLGRDACGREQWRVALPQDNTGLINPAWIRARANGHLLLVALGGRVVAIDGLTSGAGGAPRLLWSRNVNGPDDSTAEMHGLQGRIALIPMAQFPGQFGPWNGKWGPQGPLCHRYVCFQRMHSLVAVDAQTGDVLWVRQDVPSSCELFGDEEHVFVISPDQEEARLLRAADGEVLGTRDVPRPTARRQTAPGGEEKVTFSRLDESCLAAFGRRLLLWRSDRSDRELVLYDLLESRDAWPPRKFAAGAHAAMAGEEAVGIMEPNGHFVLVGLPDGRTIADLKLEAEPSLLEMSLLPIGDQYFLLTSSTPSKPLSIGPVANSVTRQPIQRGRLYAIDKQGKLQWKEPAAIKYQMLLSNQPAGLPVLVFACNNWEQVNGQNQPKSAVLCIDKREWARGLSRGVQDGDANAGHHG